MAKEEKSGKKQRKPKRRGKLYVRYQVKGGELVRTNSSCPKCGPGNTMAKHQSRKTCGKCGYTEFSRKE
ncbi:30S ribosomal protein S27ae [archaeon]|nr:30S ribosomal protein S27ae [archaeon]